MSTSLLAREHEKILILQFRDSSGYPRLARAVLHELLRHVGEAMNNSRVSGIVLRGTEQAFAVGAEIEEIARLTPLEAQEFARLGQSLMRAISAATKPVMAAIQGYCYGGGLDLALACQGRVATRDARFAHPGASLGILTGWGGTRRLPRLIGRARAAELFTTGRELSAQEALHLGLVCELIPAPNLLNAAIQRARNGR